MKNLFEENGCCHLGCPSPLYHVGEATHPVEDLRKEKKYALQITG